MYMYVCMYVYSTAGSVMPRASRSSICDSETPLPASTTPDTKGGIASIYIYPYIYMYICMYIYSTVGSVMPRASSSSIWDSETPFPASTTPVYRGSSVKTRACAREG